MAIWISEDQVTELLPMDECVKVVEQSFHKQGEGTILNKPRYRIRMPEGFFHLMSAGYADPPVVGLKTYTTFKKGGAAIVLLFDGDSGSLLATIEANNLGRIRTGAASGVASKFMARPDDPVVGIIGTGFQAITQIEAISKVRNISKVLCYSRTKEKREAFVKYLSQSMSIDAVACSSAEACVEQADIVTTITSSRVPVFSGTHLQEGTHVNAAGSNHWMRQEIDTTTVRRSTQIAVDDLTQAKIECGDLFPAIEQGFTRWESIYNLGDIVSGTIAGRPDTQAITLYESQGVAFQDIAVALHIYEKLKQ